MSRRSRSFALVTVVATLVIPVALVLLRPFGEPRAALAVSAGWGLALLAIVPSFLAMARVMGDDDSHRFHRVFMGSTLGRFVFCIVGVGAFALLADDPTLTFLGVFLLSFFLGFVVLSAAELTALLSKSPDGNHA